MERKVNLGNPPPVAAARTLMVAPAEAKVALARMAGPEVEAQVECRLAYCSPNPRPMLVVQSTSTLAPQGPAAEALERPV